MLYKQQTQGKLNKLINNNNKIQQQQQYKKYYLSKYSLLISPNQITNLQTQSYITQYQLIIIMNKSFKQNIFIPQQYHTYSSNISSNQKPICTHCKLQFQSPYQLLNHTKKFCTNSGFDTIAGLNIILKNPYHLENNNSKLNSNHYLETNKIHQEKNHHLNNYRNNNHNKSIQTKRRKLNDSLTNALQQIQKNKPFISNQKQLQNDINNYQRYKQHINYQRPYQHQSSKKYINPIYSQIKSNLINYQGRKSRSLFMKQSQQNNLKHKSGQNLHDSISSKYQSQKSKAYSFTQSYLNKFKQSNAYISPPTQHNKLQNVKQFSLLDKSDLSIKNMPEQQKRDYVIRKLLQLEGIEQTYKKNGGKSQKFVQNTIKMKKFYNELLNDVNNNKQSKFGRISNGTRVSTPISKLDQLKISNVSVQTVLKQQFGQGSNIQSKISQIHQKGIAKRQNQIRKRLKTQFPQKSDINNKNNKIDSNRNGNNRNENNNNINNSDHIEDNDVLDNELINRIKRKDLSNQIIVIPIQQPVQGINNNNNELKQRQLALKYIQNVSKLKEQQNKNFMNILQKQNIQMKRMYEQNIKVKQRQNNKNENKIKTLQNKYNKLHQTIQKQKYQNKIKQNAINQNIDILKQQNIFNQQNNKGFRINNNKKYHKIKTQYSLLNNDDIQRQYRQLYPQLTNVRLLNIQLPGYHNNNNELENHISQQQQILLQMQHQQRDQLQLFSHLPSQIQQIKIQSIKQTASTRFQMEKQILKQKLSKLKLIQQIKTFQSQRKLFTQQLQNQKKKIQIHQLMKKKIKNILKQSFQSKNTNSQQQSSQQQYNNGVTQQLQNIFNNNKNNNNNNNITKLSHQN